MFPRRRMKTFRISLWRRFLGWFTPTCKGPSLAILVLVWKWCEMSFILFFQNGFWFSSSFEFLILFVLVNPLMRSQNRCTPFIYGSQGGSTDGGLKRRSRKGMMIKIREVWNKHVKPVDDFRLWDHAFAEDAFCLHAGVVFLDFCYNSWRGLLTQWVGFFSSRYLSTESWQ